MAFFDDIGKKLSSAAKTVGQKTNDISEIRRLNVKKQAIRRQMENAYTQIGKAYYATASASTHGEADRLCDQIESMLNDIAELDKKIDKVKRQRRCPECKAVQSGESKFCSSCGAKLPEEEPEPEPTPEPEAEAAPEEPEATEVVEESNVEIDWPASSKDEASEEDAAEELDDDEDEDE